MNISHAYSDICPYTCVCVNAHIYLYMYIHICICTHMCIHRYYDDDCFDYHSWRNNVVVAFGTFSSFPIYMCKMCIHRRISMNTHIYIYIYIYIYMYIYTHIDIFVYIHIFHARRTGLYNTVVFLHTHRVEYRYRPIHKHLSRTQQYIHIYIHVYMYMYTYIYIYIYKYTHTYIHT